MVKILDGGIYNLTVMADRMRADDAANLRVLDTMGLSAELLSGAGVSEKQRQETAVEAIYVIVAGDGIIEKSDGAEVPVTAGDVLFVPARVPHRFVQHSRKFKIWKIKLPQGSGRPDDDQPSG